MGIERYGRPPSLAGSHPRVQTVDGPASAFDTNAGRTRAFLAPGTQHSGQTGPTPNVWSVPWEEPPRKSGKGRCGIPGGHLEADESAPQGAARELKEELGVVTDRIRSGETFSTHGWNGAH
ncbi:NUDIX domain-containing protein [Nocardiopsis dassonvillei]|uniref:NUDIX domain-containing protein n=1 Tax=Nocardiopsis dassonvillei TaxID=2014 RepID=UPI0035591BC4